MAESVSLDVVKSIEVSMMDISPHLDDPVAVTMTCGKFTFTERKVEK